MADSDEEPRPVPPRRTLVRLHPRPSAPRRRRVTPAGCDGGQTARSASSRQDALPKNSRLPPREEQLAGERLLLGEVQGQGGSQDEVPEPFDELVLGVDYLAQRALGVLRLPLHDQRPAYRRLLYPHLLLANTQALPGRFVAFPVLSRIRLAYAPHHVLLPRQDGQSNMRTPPSPHSLSSCSKTVGTLSSYPGRRGSSGKTTTSTRFSPSSSHSRSGRPRCRKTFSMRIFWPITSA